MPEYARSVTFEGLAVRSGEGRLIDPFGPLRALEMGSANSVCG